MYAGKRWWGTSVVFILLGLVQGKVDILGEISFDLKYPEKRAQGTTSVTEEASKADTEMSVTESSAGDTEKIDAETIEAATDEGTTPTEKSDAKKTETEVTEAVDNVTQAAPVECVYQYPETAQVDAMLSNMMNQLTKMFVRVNKYLRLGSRREDDKRFKVVTYTPSSFFDNIYFNMTVEYRRFVNHTRSSVRLRTRGDPCEHQAEIRDVWRALLDSSRESVRRAALACVEEYLRVYRGDDSATKGRARSRASQLLRRELARVRSDQLALLCDHFQLCYNELL